MTRGRPERDGPSPQQTVGCRSVLAADDLVPGGDEAEIEAVAGPDLVELPRVAVLVCGLLAVLVRGRLDAVLMARRFAHGVLVAAASNALRPLADSASHG